MLWEFQVKHNWRGAMNKNGRYPVHIYVYIDGYRPQYYPVKLPQKPSIDEWQNKSDAWVKLNSPYSFQSNNAIRTYKQKIIDLHKRLSDYGVALTHYHIHKELEFKGDRVIFNDYFKNYMKNPPEKVVLTSVTWEKYDAFIKHLDNFNPKIYFSQIDEDMVARIRNFLAAQKGKKNKW